MHGLGMLYCRGDVARGLVPAYAARSSLASRAIDRDHLEFRPDAARFETGNLNYAGIHALDAALDLILGTGVAAIQAHVLAVARALMEGLASRGVEIVTPQEDAQRAGIVVFRSAAAVMSRTPMIWPVERWFWWEDLGSLGGRPKSARIGSCQFG